MTTDLRIESMRDFHASEGNTFSDHALRCAVEGKVLLTKEQAQAVEDHLDCVGTSVDALVWGYCGRYYEIDGGYIDGESQAYWLVSSPFDPYIPAPDGSDYLHKLQLEEDGVQVCWE